jgi:ubiquinone/menaquinone biosynthesis C-methylase UbiE
MPEYVLSQERKYYEQDALWTRPIDATNRHRIEHTLRLVPDDVETVLDLGCGQGVITNHLAPHYRVTAFDLSASALGHVDPQARRVQGGALALPFRDGSFDLVLASQVIEHFPDEQQAAILAEMRRVSKRYVLIGVPAEEDIAGASVTCPACKARFHVNHHYRSYTNPMMERLTGWTLMELRTCGGQRAVVHPLLRSLGRAAGGTFETPHALCPACAAPYPVRPRPLSSLALKGANLVWRRATGKNTLRSHWIALYVKPGAKAGSLARAAGLAAAAGRAMLHRQGLFAFGEGVATGPFVVTGPAAGWNPLRWPRALLAALRSRAQWFAAADGPGCVLAGLAARLRRGKALRKHDRPLEPRDFA